jgi:ABC-type antimicrobial peptide transport system permease subunit
LKALGFRRRRVRATVRWQALTVTMLAAPVGTVLGIVAGRGAWALVAGGLRVVYSPVVPPWAVVAVVAGAMAAAVCVAALPARIASGARTSTALQVE